MFKKIALALGILFLYNSSSFAAVTPPAIAAGSCVPLQTYIATYYDQDAAVGYGYDDTNAQKLIAVLEKKYGSAPSKTGDKSVVIFVAIDLEDRLPDFFLSDAKGCFTAHLGPSTIDYALSVFQDAGVQPDFGPTFYKLPDDSQHPFTPPKPKGNSI